MLAILRLRIVKYKINYFPPSGKTGTVTRDWTRGWGDDHLPREEELENRHYNRRGRAFPMPAMPNWSHGDHITGICL